MTTIAYKDGIIAYDSRVTAGDIITDDDAEKSAVIKDVRFFFAGATSDRKRFIQLYFGESVEFKQLDCSAIVVDGEELLLVSVEDESGMWKQPLRKDIAHSIGSGSLFALTAMDMGVDAQKAIEWASKRCCRTGGKIRTFTL